MADDEKDGALLQIMLDLVKVFEAAFHAHHTNLVTRLLADNISTPVSLHYEGSIVSDLLVVIR